MNAPIVSPIPICQIMRPITAPEMGSMMVVANQMVVKCLLARNLAPRIKTRQMATIQPTTGMMAMCKMVLCPPHATGRICKEKGGVRVVQ